MYIVMEFMPGGAFLDFLRKKGAQQTKRKLCGMVIDAAKVREPAVISGFVSCIHGNYSYSVNDPVLSIQVYTPSL